jgi:Ca2+-binding EF-hand superfamily protein
MDDPSPDLIEDVNIHHQLNERHLSYRELFRRLDKNHDGRIEVDQLIELLEKVGVETSAKNRSDTAHVSCQFSRIKNCNLFSFSS